MKWFHFNAEAFALFVSCRSGRELHFLCGGNYNRTRKFDLQKQVLNGVTATRTIFPNVGLAKYSIHQLPRLLLHHESHGPGKQGDSSGGELDSKELYRVVAGMLPGDFEVRVHSSEVCTVIGGCIFVFDDDAVFYVCVCVAFLGGGLLERKLLVLSRILFLRQEGGWSFVWLTRVVSVYVD